MKGYNTIRSWQKERAQISEKSLGFVPTMGALHKGHVSLVERSLRENDKTLVSIFVNPTQFNDKSDFENYPLKIEQDLALLNSLGVDYVLYPPYEELYPDNYRYQITENKLSRQFCGQHRPGHFDGVLTVVMKLLNIASADKAYFGEKDYQQYLLVKDMASAFFINTEIIPCPIVREKDHLAMSSRNSRLTEEERKKAQAFYQALQSSSSASEALDKLKKSGFNPDYVEDFRGRRLGAVNLGRVRLIDNVEI